jgi:hypothetical protein
MLDAYPLTRFILETDVQTGTTLQWTEGPNDPAPVALNTAKFKLPVLAGMFATICEPLTTVFETKIPLTKTLLPMANPLPLINMLPPRVLTDVALLINALFGK